MNSPKLILIAFLSFLIGGCSNASKASPNDNAPVLKSEIATIGNFVIPSLLGWDRTVDITPDKLAIGLQYIPNLNPMDSKGTNVYYGFYYSPADTEHKSFTASDIKGTAFLVLKALAEDNNAKTTGIHIKVLVSKPTTFNHAPAYITSIHFNFSDDPKVLDTHDVKTLYFSDGRDLYNLSVSIDNASSDLHSRQLADQVWQKLLKEMKPIEIRKNAVKLAITKVVNQPKNITVTFKATNLTKQPLRLSNYSLLSSLRYLHLTSESGKSIFLNGVKTQVPPKQEFVTTIAAGATRVIDVQVPLDADVVSQKEETTARGNWKMEITPGADAIKNSKGKWQYQLTGDLHFADNALTHVYREPFSIAGNATIQ